MLPRRTPLKSTSTQRVSTAATGMARLCSRRLLLTPFALVPLLPITTHLHSNVLDSAACTTYPVQLHTHTQAPCLPTRQESVHRQVHLTHGLVMAALHTS